MDFIKGGALVAIIVGFWEKIKSFLWMGISTFVQRVEINSEETHEAVTSYLISKFGKAKLYDKTYGSQYESFRNGKYGLVPYEKFGTQTMVFWRNHKRRLLRFPFLFSHKKVAFHGTEGVVGSHEGGEKTYSSIVSIRGTLDVEEIVREAVLARNNLSWSIDDQEQHTNRFDIFYFPERSNQSNERSGRYSGLAWYKQGQFKLLGVDQNDLGRQRTSNGKALDNLFFPMEVKELIRVIELWVRSKDWYREKSIPWKRGWLLYGPPGTGKTALARAFAEDLDMPIYFFSLAQMSNADLINAWQSMQLNVPCIALIEDIDNVFDKRKNISQNSFTFSNPLRETHSRENEADDQSSLLKTPLTFDTLLNCIDGVDKTDGVFTIITTNDISKIDPAIGVPKVLEDGTQEFVSTRPGRVDRAIELTFMRKENKLEMSRKILCGYESKLVEVEKHIDLDEQETPAQFQEYCSQIALKEFWKSQVKH